MTTWREVLLHYTISKSLPLFISKWDKREGNVKEGEGRLTSSSSSSSLLISVVGDINIDGFKAAPPPRLFLLCWQLQSRSTSLSPAIPNCIYFWVYFNIWARWLVRMPFSFFVYVLLSKSADDQVYLCVLRLIHMDILWIRAYISFVFIHAHTCTAWENFCFKLDFLFSIKYESFNVC